MIAIGFSTSDWWISRLIRWFTNSTVSHVWILHEAYGSQYIMEATASGFRIMEYERFKRANKVIYTHNILEDFEELNIDPSTRLNNTARWLGDKYDFLGVLKFLLKPLKIWKGMSTPRKLQCSEAISRHFAPELFPGLDPEWSTPELLYSALRQHKHD
jgi:hypothetical protein